MTAFSRWAGLLAVLLLAACGGPEQNCDFVVVAKVPLEVQNKLLVVPVGVGGKWVRLLVDTGAERTAISEEAVARLGLNRDSKNVTRSTGLGGTFTAADATVPGLVLGGVRFPVDRVSVAQLRFGPGLTADGLLGSDLLLAFDLDIDIPKGVLTMYRARQCADVNPPWQEPYERVIGVRALRDRLLVPLELDGVKGMGILDTGAQATTIGPRMATRLGLTAQTLARDQIVRHHGAGPGTQEARLHRFGLLRIGATVTPGPLLSVLPVDAGVGDALVGEDFIDGRRIWMSFASRDVFVATAKPGAER